MDSRVFNVGMLEVAHGFVIAGERWIRLRFGYAGDDSPLVVQMPEKAWADALAARSLGGVDDDVLKMMALGSERSHCTLDNCGHMRQLDAIVDLLGMHRVGISVLDELRRRAATDWEDTDDEWTEAIKDAHPARSESHDEYGVAMRMVGHRHSKGELVALVNWLLVEKAKLNAGHQESERQFQAKCDEIGALLGKAEELTAQRDAFGQKAHQLQDEVLRVRALIHRYRTGLTEAIERMVKEAAGRLWVAGSRGPYAWDDEKYREEAGTALRAVIEIGKKALGDSGDNADSAFRPETPKVVMWGDRKMKEGRCPPGNMCLACDRLGKHLEPAG